MMSVAPIFLKHNLQLGIHADSKALWNALLHWCCSCRNLGASSTTSAENGTAKSTFSRTGRGKAKANTGKNCGSSGHWVKDCWREGGEHTTTLTTIQTKGNRNLKGTGKSRWTWCKRVSLPKQHQLCRIPHRLQARLTLFGEIQTQQKEWIMSLRGVRISSLSSTAR